MIKRDTPIQNERRSERRTVATEYLHLMFNLLHQQQISSAQLVRGTGVPVRVIESADSYITAEQYHLIINNALRLSRNPLLGFELGSQLQLSDHGFLGFAVMASETLGQAFTMAIRYAKTRTQLVDLRFNNDGDSVTLHILRNRAIGSSFHFVVQNIITTFINMMRILTDDSDELTAFIRLTDSAIADPSAYERYLGVPIYFDQQENQICFPTYLLELPVSTANTNTRRVAELECEKQLARIQVGDDLISAIHKQLDQLQSFPILAVMSDRLNTSPRTLNRKLAQLNTTYQKIIDEKRHFLAIKLLSEGHQSIEDVAATLGYNDTSNFSRAFRRWQGVTPNQYRQATRIIV